MLFSLFSAHVSCSFCHDSKGETKPCSKCSLQVSHCWNAVIYWRVPALHEGNKGVVSCVHLKKWAFFPRNINVPKARHSKRCIVSGITSCAHGSLCYGFHHVLTSTWITICVCLLLCFYSPPPLLMLVMQPHPSCLLVWPCGPFTSRPARLTPLQWATRLCPASSASSSSSSPTRCTIISPL